MAIHRSEEMDGPRGGSCLRRWRGRWFWRTLLMILLAGSLYFASLRHRWVTEFHRKVVAIHAAGFPVTGKELDASYAWPSSGENAANWITGAATVQQKLDQEQWKPLEAILSRGSERLRPAEPLSAELKKRLDEFIQANARALESLHEAAAISECRYSVDLSQGLSTLTPHVTDVRDGCRLLGVEAAWHAENGNAKGVVEVVETLLRVARSLDQEPMMFSHLVRMGGANGAIGPLERALSRIAFTDEQLAQLQKVLGDVHGDEGLLRALVGNRCMYLVAFQCPQALDREQFGRLLPVPLLEAYNALGFSARDGIVFLDYMEECIRILQLPVSKRPAAAEVAAGHVHARRGLFLRDVGYTAFAIRRDMQEMAWTELATAALAVERYRLARGGLPETLDQLVPGYLAAVPADPFDGAPLRYKRVDRGFVVYSVGEDGRDDGGKEQPRSRQGQTYDLVFRVEQ